VAGPIRVDIEGLDRLADKLRLIQHRLNDLGRDFDTFDSAIGAPVVRDRLAEVAGNWSRARQRINGHISHLADMAATAAEHYRTREAEISQSFRSPPPPGG
jgi:hypothetical protein